MTISRWKVMAGVLGVSLGGLAAIAGQCPKPDAVRTQRAEAAPPALPDAPKPVPPGGSGKPTPTAPPVVADLPALPIPAGPGELLPPPLPIPAALPDVPPPAPKAVKVEAPSLPSAPAPVAAKPEPKPVTPPKPLVSDVPQKGTTVGLTAAGSFTPDLDVPARATPPVAPSVPEAPKPSTTPTFTAPPAPPVAVQAEGFAVPSPEKSPVVAASASTAVNAVKFRIVLRVGEGEPTFEVRHGDDLVMKVLCEKVDVKSPEKGHGLSAVTATGKVRFVGFGSEGTCDSFSFMAGTGEVAMAGNVKVQVKDKIGRVESELTTEQMKYKLDTSAMPGVLKP